MYRSVLSSSLDWGVKVYTGPTSGLILVASAKVLFSATIILLSSSITGLPINILGRKVWTPVRNILRRLP